MASSLFKLPKDEIREIVVAMLQLAIKNGHVEIVKRADGQDGYRVTNEGRLYLAMQKESGHGE